MKVYGVLAAAAALALSGCAATDTYDGYAYDGYGEPAYGYYDGYSYRPSYGYGPAYGYGYAPPPVIHRHTTIVRPAPPVIIQRGEVERRATVTEQPRRSFRQERDREPERRQPNVAGRAERDGQEARRGERRDRDDREREQRRERQQPWWDQEQRDRRG